MNQTNHNANPSVKELVGLKGRRWPSRPTDVAAPILLRARFSDTYAMGLCDDRYIDLHVDLINDDSIRGMR